MLGSDVTGRDAMLGGGLVRTRSTRSRSTSRDGLDVAVATAVPASRDPVLDQGRRPEQ